MNIHYNVQEISSKLNIEFKAFTHASNCELRPSREQELLVMTPIERSKANTCKSVVVQNNIPVTPTLVDSLDICLSTILIIVIISE